MSKYNVEQKALKTKVRRKEPARLDGKSFRGEDRGAAGASPSSRNIHPWHCYFQLITR
jgi:hypothetical protein